MNKIRIILDDETLQVSPFNSISSIFFVQVDNISFPSDHWTDLSASVIEMWLSEINNHLLSVKPVTTLYFMDGDYEIRLQQINGRCSAANFVGSNGKVVHCANIDSLYFSRQMLSAASKLSNSLQENTCASQIERIRELSQKLRSTIHKLTMSRDNFR